MSLFERTESKSTATEEQTSRRKTMSNRVNAQKSTGPKSAAGKAIVAQNARKHGLLSDSMTFSNSKEKVAFEQFVTDIVEDVAPEGMRERMLAQDMSASWSKMQTAQRWLTQDLNTRRKLAKKAMAATTNQFGYRNDAEEKPPHQFEARLGTSVEALLRYEAASKRDFYRALDKLNALQQGRMDREKVTRVGVSGPLRSP